MLPTVCHHKIILRITDSPTMSSANINPGKSGNSVTADASYAEKSIPGRDHIVTPTAEKSQPRTLPDNQRNNHHRASMEHAHSFVGTRKRKRFDAARSRAIPRKQVKSGTPALSLTGPTQCSMKTRESQPSKSRTGPRESSMHKLTHNLAESCPLCKESNCDGECLKNCFICGNRHFVKDCTCRKGTKDEMALSKFLHERRVCTLCLMPVEDRADHGVRGQVIICPAKKRFRAVIRSMSTKHVMEYDKYVMYIHFSRESFDKYLNKRGLCIK